MKSINLSLLIVTSSGLFADNYTREIAEKDINSISQCKNQDSEECKEIKQQIKEFFDAIEPNSGWFSDDYENQQFFKEIIDEKGKNYLLPSEKLEHLQNLNREFRNQYAPEAIDQESVTTTLVRQYLHLKNETESKMNFKEFVHKMIISEKASQWYEIYRKAQKLTDDLKKKK